MSYPVPIQCYHFQTDKICPDKYPTNLTFYIIIFVCTYAVFTGNTTKFFKDYLLCGGGGLKSAVLGCRVAYFTDPPSGSNSSEGCMHGGVLPHFGHNLIQPRERGSEGDLKVCKFNQLLFPERALNWYF
jgi:hypothetical protein